jgi:hypothetical protein
MRTALAVLLAVFALTLSSQLALGQSDPYAPDIPEPGSVEAIAEYTTSEEYLPVSVSYVPEHPTIPSPHDVLGRVSGAPGELSKVSEVHGYFKALAGASPRVLVSRIGTSIEDREILLAVISSESNLAELEALRELTADLADPRRTDRDAMNEMIGRGKVVYHLLGGLHSPETGSPEMLMELAYRLAVSEKPEIQIVRDNVIVLITPVVEPDGRDRVVEWYYRHLKDKDLPYRELRRFGSPPYWGHYVLHDNNRDGMQLTLPLTRAINDTYWNHHPQVVHDLHESLPLLYISTGHGPYSLAVDPVTINEWTQFAHHEASELQAMGLPGVWTWGFWDGWWPGYLFSVANNHNSVGRFYETFGNSMGGTFERKLEERKFVGKPVTEAQWYRPWPPDKEVEWALRNNTNYMQAGVLQALEYAGTHREELLRNFWVKSKRAMDKGATEAPHAWIFPEAQRDSWRLAYLVNQLQAHHIEVHRLSEELALADTTYPAGSYVVRLDQPYRNAAVNFLENQEFPKDEPNPPYDDVAWTWPLMYGVTGAEIDEKEVLEASMAPVTGPAVAQGAVVGDQSAYLLQDTGQTSLLAARVMLGQAQVEALEDTLEYEGETYAPGSWLVQAPRSDLENVARKFGLTFTGVDPTPDVRRHEADLPRLGVYQTWVATQDCGWVRYTLDVDKIPYTLLSDEDLRKGDLSRRFDVILFPRTWGDLKRIVHGIDPAYGPLAYTKTREYPSHGIPNASSDITGGMGFEGLANLKEFIDQGGVFVTMASAGQLPVDGGLVRTVSKTSVGRTPGSFLRAKVLRPDHPITYGYEELTSVFRGSGPVFDVHDDDRHLAVVQFGTKQVPKGDEEGEKSKSPKAGGKLLLSGYLQDPGKIDGKPAILDVPTGEGRVVLFAFNPMHRYLNHADFRYVYNIILNWNDLP